MNICISRRTLFVRWNAIALARKEAWCFYRSEFVALEMREWLILRYIFANFSCIFSCEPVAWFQMKSFHLPATNISLSIENSWMDVFENVWMSPISNFLHISVLYKRQMCIFYARFHRTDAHKNDRMWFVHVFDKILFFFSSFFLCWKSVVFAFRGHSHQLLSCVL